MNVSAARGPGPNTDRAARDMEKLREASDAVVGSVFFGTMFKAMRDSKTKGAYGHGGRGEEVFSAQLHGLYAERMGSALQHDLGESLLRRLGKQQRLLSQRNEQSVSVAEYVKNGAEVKADYADSTSRARLR